MRVLAVAALAALVVAAVPAGGAEPVPTPPCASSAQYQTLGIAGTHKDVATPLVPNIAHNEASQPAPAQSISSVFLRFDSSGSTTVPTATQGQLVLNITWDNQSDFDVYVYDAAGSEIGSGTTFDPEDGAGAESILLAGVKHCTDLRVDVNNYAGLPTSAIDLDVVVSKLK